MSHRNHAAVLVVLLVLVLPHREARAQSGKPAPSAPGLLDRLDTLVGGGIDAAIHETVYAAPRRPPSAPS
ncbi:MAG: hypothetical protein AB7O28_14155 [Vicinamibacterales bacterium]